MSSTTDQTTILLRLLGSSESGRYIFTLEPLCPVGLLGIAYRADIATEANGSYNILSIIIWKVWDGGLPESNPINILILLCICFGNLKLYLILLCYIPKLRYYFIISAGCNFA